MKAWRGFCAACREDLYGDPRRHYISRSHAENVRRANEREAKQREQMSLGETK